MKYCTVLLYMLLVLTNQSNGNTSRLPDYMLRRAVNEHLDPFSMFSNPLLSSNEPDDILYAASYKHRKWRNSPFRFSHQQAALPPKQKSPQPKGSQPKSSKAKSSKAKSSKAKSSKAKSSKVTGSKATGSQPNCEIENRQCGCPLGPKKPKKGPCCPAFAFRGGQDCFGHGVCRLEKWVTDAYQAAAADTAVKNLRTQADAEKAARDAQAAARAAQKAKLAGAAIPSGANVLNSGTGLTSQGADLASQANVHDATHALKTQGSSHLSNKLSSFMFMGFGSRIIPGIASKVKPYKLNAKQQLQLFGKHNQPIYLPNLDPALRVTVDIRDPAAAISRYKKEHYCDAKSQLCAVCQCQEGYTGPVCMDANNVTNEEPELAPCIGLHYGQEDTAFARLERKFGSEDPCDFPQSPQYPDPPEDPIMPPASIAPIDDTVQTGTENADDAQGAG